MSDFYCFRLRSGRKDHPCASCGRVVSKGAKSFACAGVFDGDFNSYRQCVPCKQLVDRLYANGAIYPGEAYQLDELGEIARDAGEIWPPEPVTELANINHELGIEG